MKSWCEAKQIPFCWFFPGVETDNPMCVGTKNAQRLSIQRIRWNCQDKKKDQSFFSEMCGPEVTIFAFYEGRREKGGWRSLSLFFLFLFTQFIVANGEEKNQNKTEQFEQR